MRALPQCIQNRSECFPPVFFEPLMNGPPVKRFLTLLCLVVLSGCTFDMRITNNGPNPIDIYSDPSPSSPELPQTIQVSDFLNLSYGPAIAVTADVNVVDTTAPASVTKTITLNFLSDNRYTWNGTDLVPDGQ